MKQYYIKFSVISIFLVLFFSNENPLFAENSKTLASTSVAPTVTTTVTPTSVGVNSAVLSGSATGDGTNAIIARGIVYSDTNNNPEIGGTNVTQAPNATGGDGTFYQSISGLAAGTQYSFKAYAIDNASNVVYGNVATFTTVSLPTVTTTTPATSITGTSATLAGNVTDEGGSTVTERGIIYSTSNADLVVFGTDVIKVVNGAGGPGAFSQSITGLTAGTTYYFKAYATNNNGTNYGYGAEVSFTTIVAPTVTTTAASSIASTSVTLGGNTVSGTITEKGVVYSITSENSNPEVFGTGVTKVANGTTVAEDFSQSITGLTVGTEYSFKAYVTNDNGTTYIYGDPALTFTTTGKTWSGGTGGATTDWATAANWTPSGVPTASDDVIIPNTATTNQPIISAAGAVANNLTIESSNSLTIESGGSLTISVDLTVTTANSLTIESGGSLIVQNTSTGTIAYKRNLATTNWYLLSSPVSDESIDDLIANNPFATSGGDIGLAPYDNSEAVENNRWSYYTSSTGNGNVVDGKGYSAKLSATGDVTFQGTLNTSDVSIAITQGTGDNFNLLGNPFTASINSGTFLTANTSELTAQTIWVWNTDSYEAKVASNGFKLAPAQGFFVECGTAGDVTFAKSTQSHETPDTFLRQTTPEIKVVVADESTSRYAEIYYYENATTGFDNGYDGELFGGVQNSFEIYSHLLTDNQNKKYQIQSLSNTDLETTVVPMGLKAAAGKEITFSVETLNLPTDLKVFLEDKEANIFTRLDETNTEYTVTLSEALNGVGRFYLHTSASALTVDDATLSTVHIYKSDVSTLRIVGLPQGNTTVKLYNVLGKQVLNTSFDDTIKDISLPKLATGVYIAEIQTAIGKLNQKIILE